MMPSHTLGAVAVAVLATLAACRSQSSSAGGAARPPAPIVITDEREATLSAAMGQRIILEDPTVGEAIAAEPRLVQQAMIVAYNELGIPSTVVNPNTGLVAAVEHKAFGRLGKTNLSRYVSCGDTMTGARADQDRVVISVISRVKPVKADTSRVETRVVATASGAAGASERFPCVTTGELESRLHRAARVALGLVF
jgi:hypothetical protein